MDRKQLEAKFSEFAAIATAWHPNDNIVNAMQVAFAEELHGEADNIWDLIDAATRTFHRHHVGVWLDHTEGYLAYDNCAAVITNSILDSDSCKNWEGERTDIVWPGAPSHESVAEGLLGFKGWLHANSGLTLVHVHTGADFYFSVVVEQTAEAALVDWISDEGGRLEIVKAPRKLRVRSIVDAYLTERYEFAKHKQESDDPEYTYWEKEMADPSYTAVVALREYGGRRDLTLGVYNKDLQRTFEQTRQVKLTDRPFMFRRIRPEFFGGKPMFRYSGAEYFETDAALIAETHEVLDGCVAKFLAVAGSQEQLIQDIESKNSPMPTIVLALVRGWNEAAEEKFLRPKEERLVELKAEDPESSGVEYNDRYLTIYRGWIAANPSGLPGW